MTPETRGPWLARGLIAGSLLGLVESVFVASTSRDLPLIYFASNTLWCLAAAVVVSFVAHFSRRGREGIRGFPEAFLLVAAGTFALWCTEKAVALSTARGISPVAGIVFLVLLVSAGLGGAFVAFRRRSSVQSSELAFTLGLAFFYLWMVGGRHLTKTIAGVYFSVSGVAANVFLASGLAVAIGVLDRHRPRRHVPPGRIAWALTLAATIGCVVMWKIQTSPPLEFSARREASDSVPGKNVVLITIDTLRADRVSMSGYRRNTTPALDRLARESLLFRRAVSPATWTFPGHLAILTGKLPRRLGLGAGGVDPNTDPDAPPMRAPETLDTLAEILSRAGYETAAFVSNSAYLKRAWGFDQGFRLYDDRGYRSLGYEAGINGFLRLFPVVFDGLAKPYRTADRINDTVFQWLESRGSRPFFIFVNYMEPHEPYAPPAPYHFEGRDLFVRSPATAVLNGDRSIAPRESRHFDAVYDGEVAYVDSGIGSLLDRLRELRLYHESLIIVTSDHGEFLGEHDLWGHGYGPYQPLHHVPLVIKLPGAATGQVIDRWVQTTDIFPTVLDQLSLPIPVDIDGRVLPDGDHPVVIEQSPNRILGKYGKRFLVSYRGIYRGPWKFIEFSDGAKELYNVELDPRETTNLIAQRRELAVALSQELADYLASVPADEASVEPTVLDERSLRELRGLGYVP